jgi:hypothetical protein
MAPPIRKRWKWVVLLLAYVGSYLALSAAGKRTAAELDIEGYFFVVPTTPTRDWVNLGCYVFYSPLILTEAALTSERRPIVRPPLFRLY